MPATNLTLVGQGPPPTGTPEPGANLYNSYHFLTQLAGIYSLAAQYAPDHKDQWNRLCDQTINDLGLAVGAWEAAIQQAKGQTAPRIDERVAARAQRLCKRLDAAANLLSVWTPMEKWSRLLAAFESRWAGVLVAFAASNLEVAKRLIDVQKGIRLRIEILGRITADAAAARPKQITGDNPGRRKGG